MINDTLTEATRSKGSMTIKNHMTTPTPAAAKMKDAGGAGNCC